MIGLVCHFLVETSTGKVVNSITCKSLQFGRYKSQKYSREFVKATYVDNVRTFSDNIPVILRAGFGHFRVSSAMLPLADVVDRELWDNDDVKRHLRRAGEFALKHDMRITVHPGQYTVLSSDSSAVVSNSVRELELHGWIFDEMGLPRSPKYAINVHGGKRGRSSKLVSTIETLPDSVRSRLTLENDESCYSVVDLLEVHKSTGVPVCWDSHHHTFNDGFLTLDEAFEASCATWPNGVKPLQHLSNSKPGAIGRRARDHSDYVSHVPKCQFDGLASDTIDVEIEAKMKNLAILDAVKRLGVRL